MKTLYSLIACACLILCSRHANAVSVTITKTNILCAGAATGSATANASGGAFGVYYYHWSNGQTTKTINNLTAGTYSVTVSTIFVGSNGYASTTITQPTPIVASTATYQTCAGQCNGLATISVAGGTPPYTYHWSTGATGSTASNLCTGTDSVLVIDANGCLAARAVLITNYAPPAVSFVSHNPTCYGSCNGTITALAFGAYSYHWSTGANTSTVHNLCAGTYSVTITGINGCHTVRTFTLVQPAPVFVTTTSTNALCSGGTGSATASASGSTGTFTYQWSNGASTSTINGLVTGTYSVTAVSSSGCTGTASVTITASPAPEIVYATQSATCYGACNGTIYTSVYGGTLPYTYQWSTGSTSDHLLNACPGLYHLTVTDAYGCLALAQPIVTQPALLSANVTTSGLTCNASFSGTANLNITGGTPPYSVQWTNGLTGNSLSNLAAGTYCAAVTDANGCTTFACGIVTQPDSLNANDSYASGTCAGSCFGFIQLAYTGGTEPYSYAWSNGGSTNPLTSLCAGYYTVTVTDANNCIAVSSYDVFAYELCRTAETTNEDMPMLNAYPNPFAGDAVIRIMSPQAEAHAVLVLYNAAGRRVAELFNGPLDANHAYTVPVRGDALPAGVYTYRLLTRDGVYTGNMVRMP